MIRRTPTRIELKLDDISEYEQIKREVEAKRAMAKHNLLGSSPINTVQAPKGRSLLLLIRSLLMT